VLFLSCRVLCCCGVVLVVSRGVLFLLYVCVCDLFIFTPVPPTGIVCRCEPPGIHTLPPTGIHTLFPTGIVRRCEQKVLLPPEGDGPSPPTQVFTPHTPPVLYLAGASPPAFTDGVYTKETRAHTHKELIREWLWEPKGSSLEYI